MSRATGSIWTGIGVGLLFFALELLDVDPPTAVKIALLLLAVALILFGLWASDETGDVEDSAVASGEGSRAIRQGSAGRDQIASGRDTHVYNAPAPVQPSRTFNEVIGDAETELSTLLDRLADARDEGRYGFSFVLPADQRQAVCNALEQRDRDVRQLVDDAYRACDRLSNRLNEPGRFSGRLTDGRRASARDGSGCRIVYPQTIAKVCAALDALIGSAHGSAPSDAPSPHLVIGDLDTHPGSHRRAQRLTTVRQALCMPFRFGTILPRATVPRPRMCVEKSRSLMRTAKCCSRREPRAGPISPWSPRRPGGTSSRSQRRRLPKKLERTDCAQRALQRRLIGGPRTTKRTKRLHR